MKTITTGDIARALKKFFPQINQDHINHDVDCGRLPCHPRFGAKGWYYPIPEEIPEYLEEKQVPPDIIEQVAARLGLKSAVKL